MVCFRYWNLLASCCLLLVLGCRMGVPIHVWQPPALRSTVGKKVVVSAVVGPDEIAEKVRHKLVDMAPTDTGRVSQLVDSAQIQRRANIQLVSAIGQQPSDLAVASMSRQEDADFILRGEIIEDRHADPDEPPSRDLKISWRLTPLKGTETVGGSPVVVDYDSAIERYPDLALLNQADDVLTTAAVRDTYRLIAPSVQRERVQLEIAYWLPGSKEVRRGNAQALAGRWGEAEAIWNQVLAEHPLQVAALHNLAIAAAAGQDFSRAKELARKAIRRQPSKLHKQTLVWIELKQRAMHQSFGLPDPPEGWFVTPSH